MKKIYKIMTVALAGVLAVGCNDLDTEPLGSIVTEKQKAEVIAGDPEGAVIKAVSSLQAGTNIGGQFYSDNHRSYGLASIFIGQDCRGVDMIGPDDGYNWYSSESSFADWQGNYYANLIFWQYNYTMIFTANNQLATMDKASEDPMIQYAIGQALGYRAYSYYMLCNMYQLTYAENPDAPCVPILTEETMNEAGMNGCARGTVAQVWEQVINDCTNAIAALKKGEAGGVSREDRRFVDPAVMYGLRARANLFTMKYADAASDAEEAIRLALAQGITPLSSAEASVPGFYQLNAHNYMWGIQNLESNAITRGVNNFSSMMSGWMTNGYGAVGCVKRISKKLYKEISNTDVRKNWWLDGEGKVPAALPTAYKSYISGLGDKKETVFPAYANVKFAAAGNTPGGTSGAVDVPIMRVEEMYLIKAEAEGMQNPATGAATLTSFVKTYRDAAYTCSAATKDDFRAAVWLQRRIELWGEGFAYFDIMRFRTGIDRRGCGFPSGWVFVVAPTEPVMRYQIIQDEAQSNPLIGDVLEGLDWVTPEPVADEN